jgi:hypothetical protein
MQPPTHNSTAPLDDGAQRAARRRRAWIATLGLLAACGGTTGLENLLGGGNPSAPGLDASPVDATLDGTGDDGASGDDASEDRSPPGRPPPQDGGVLMPPPTRDAGGGITLDAGADAPPLTTQELLHAISPACYTRIVITDAGAYWDAGDAGDAGDAADGAGDDGGPIVMEMGCAAINGCLDTVTQGASCELFEGLAPDAGPPHYASTLPSGKTCRDVIGPEPVSETSVCLQTLQRIFSTGCAATLNTTDCLCGPGNAGCIYTLPPQPMGALYETYACDFNSTSGATINSHFTDYSLNFGAAAANQIIQCIASFANGDSQCCECMGGSFDAGTGTCTPGP